MITMYDSDNPDSIPDGVFAAGYVDGYAANAWNARGWNRFPNARRIAVFASTNKGNVGDVERGDMLPWELPDWIQMRRNAGEVDPWGYVNLSNWGPTKTEFRLRGIPEPNWWVADYDGVATIFDGAVAKQYADPAIIPGNPHYDLSVVNEVFGPGGNSLGGDDLLADERAWLKVAARGFLGSPPVSLNSIGDDAAILNKFGTTNTNDFITQYGQDGYDWASALYHGWALKIIGSGSGGTEPAEPTKFSGTIQGTLT